MKKTYYLSALILVLLFVCGLAYAQTDTTYVKALEQYEKGNFNEAIIYLKDFVSRRPEPSAYYLIGYALYKQKKFDEAEEYFKQTYLIDPNFSPRSLEYFEKQSPEEIEALEQFAKPTEEPEAEPEMPVETAPPVVEAEPEPATMPEPATPPTVAQPSPQPTKPQQIETAPQPTAPQQVAPPPQPTAPQHVQPPPQQQRPSPQPYRPQPRPGQPFAPSFIAMFLGGFMLAAGIVGVVLYLFFALCLFKIGKKLNVEMAWLAFIPIVQVWVFVASAGKPGWWILLLFVPLINFFIGIYLWMCIAENLGKSKWLGILMILPLINLVMLAIFAFSKSEAGAMGGLSEFEGASFDESDLSSFVPPSDEDEDDTF